MYNNRMIKIVEKIDKLLNDNNIWANVYEHNELPVVFVDINWGDWKHSHLRTKYLLENIGCLYLGEDVTEEDGSDCYSAIHKYIVVDVEI